MSSGITFNAVYVDRRATSNRVESSTVNSSHPGSRRPSSNGVSGNEDHEEVERNIRTLLSVFSSVSVCTSSQSCISAITDIERRDNGPTLVVFDIPLQPQPGEDDALDTTTRHDSGLETDMLYGMPLLRFICREIDSMRLSSSFIPVALVSQDNEARILHTTGSPESDLSSSSSVRELQCIDHGAFDALTSPVSLERAKTLYMHCYRLGSENQTKWQKAIAINHAPGKVAAEPNPNYAYLRENMVSELMNEICKPKTALASGSGAQIRIPRSRIFAIKQSVGEWAFCAHDYTDKELVYCAQLIFEHAFSMPELGDYKISSGHLTEFLLACRDAYRAEIPYHNFRHVVDVLQAVFFFLLQLGALPPYSDSQAQDDQSNARPLSLATLITPLDALTLLVVAVGHDVGHPGVNNAFLISLKAPIAQVYNDRSVLESFHCAAFSQVLRKYWPKMLDTRKMMIDLILATDMGLHFDYMGKLDKLKKKCEREARSSWDAKQTTEYRNLLCALLIKCADISNVARKHEVSAKWATILIDEFARQASMEIDLGIPSCLVAPPVTGSVLALARSQVGFMNLFAMPLFENLSTVLPEMRFSVDELGCNRDLWAHKIEECTAIPDAVEPRPPAPVNQNDSEAVKGMVPLRGPLPITAVTPATPGTGRNLPPVLGTVLMESDMPRSSDATPSMTSGAGSRDELSVFSLPTPPVAQQEHGNGATNGASVKVIVTHPSTPRANGFNSSREKKPTYQYSTEHLRGAPPSEMSSASAIERPRSSPPEFGDASEHSCQKGCCGPTVVTGTVERRSSRFFQRIKVWKPWRRDGESNSPH
ncbi:HD-domain/PDEase-like protein [Ascodesmis nigricans]|uniref:Phosphodiesterase n=1 Tax=Ascodesmis nigricans TaxID=341454 RepID=A0A4S2N0C5_9PEZI|nr:HD-domain/PDEase-like protein [Ascodesmis nigricans]